MIGQGAIDAALHKSVEKLGHNPWILIAGCFALFSLGSFTIGIVWIPYGIGWGCAGINPFGVLIAQNDDCIHTFWRCVRTLNQ